MKKKSQKKIKIISGKWKGRTLILPKNQPKLRPTKNQIRETLFNWLNPIIYKTRCLDCFAGSGILGLEAISRGASISFLLENNSIIRNYTIKNLQTLKIKNAISILTNSIFWLKKTKKIFDIVFIDPPFQKKTLLKKTIKILEKKILSKNAWIYIETNANSSTNVTIPKIWKKYKKKITGNVLYQLYHKST
ncbi:Ribosomal RNA small subunit methyltransferase D [Candidatus Westeberhardia cardiocondylae]|uniref:Ribosomal RNA small subunit methyltransferase D n=1 Tax=Candidatus Westeberhardia cardiocondylae TaxID=1594731 RepID=A0A0H5BWG6_9ENTR|nr:16S rRNA (guanine(966)-N(2))-methyltransferase RsmD [Candidatus Westeberhardia cardiocondylae]MCR3756153.1 16S rRNA m(2)G966 methyltransferase [Candidatus Westeberhardia cardiocondylae]CEN32030.1 Ribosomal RNA small subunit methyltransferase D [Candidatus Westeberhardia cardiocondylae]